MLTLNHSANVNQHYTKIGYRLKTIIKRTRTKPSICKTHVGIAVISVDAESMLKQASAISAPYFH